jgi:ankyrin repeat protein
MTVYSPQRLFLLRSPILCSLSDHLSTRANNSRRKILVNQQDVFGSAPLHLAAFHGHVHCVNTLLLHPDIDVDRYIHSCSSPFHWAICGAQLTHTHTHTHRQIHTLIYTLIDTHGRPPRLSLSLSRVIYLVFPHYRWSNKVGPLSCPCCVVAFSLAFSSP